MADINNENKVSGVFGGVEFGNDNFNDQQQNQFQVSNGKNLPVKQGFWSKFKAFWLQDVDWNKEIVVELTPHQQKVENEINDFLHQDVTWEKVHDFLFQEVRFGKNKTQA